MSCSRSTAQPLLRLARAQVAPSRSIATSASASALFVAPNTARRKGNAAQGLPRLTTTPAKPTQSLTQLIQTLALLKAEGKKPTAVAYNALMRAAADYANRRGNNLEAGDKSKTIGFEIAMAAYRDAEAGGIDLGTEAVDNLFRFSHLHPDVTPSLLLDLMERKQSTPTAYNTLAGEAVRRGHVDGSVHIVLEMMEQGIAPERAVLQNTVRMACQWGMSRLAWQLVQRFEQMPGASRVDVATWVMILQASADQHFVTGVEAAWERVVINKSFTPDEGLVLNILSVAGRWGRTHLATQALEILPEIGVEAREHHLTPLIQAFCREGRVPDAMKTVGQMRAAGIIPSMSTVEPIVNVLKTAELVDQAFYALEDIHKAGEAVDVVAFNAVITASARQGDLQRARATQMAAGELGVTANVDTFNTILNVCVRTRHRELGDTILSDMSAAEVPPNAQTFETLIRLCLTQRTYEDAFYYLEKMKSERFKPSADIYSAVGAKCASNEDARWRLVGEEMTSLNYKVPDFTKYKDRSSRPQHRGQGNDRRRNDGGRDRPSRDAGGEKVAE